MNNLESVLIALRQIIRATDLHSKWVEKTTGLTTPQILILQSIDNNAGMTVGKLAKQISLSQATVTTIMDRLEQKKYILRERSSEDKRKVNAYLTELGRTVLEKAPQPLQDSFSSRFQNLKEWEQSLILSSLQRTAYMMDADHIDAAPVLFIGDFDKGPNTNIEVE
jgi:DNA-binding MarR family transcriptional regulator